MESSAPKLKTPAEEVTYKKIQARIESVLNEANLEKALEVILGLEEEVKTMPMSERFIETERDVMGLSESESERERILRNLAKIKNDIVFSMQALKDIVESIEQTKKQ